MAFLLRRILRPIIVTAVLGFVVRKLMESNDPRAQRVGNTASRFLRLPRQPRSQQVTR